MGFNGRHAAQIRTYSNCTVLCAVQGRVTCSLASTWSRVVESSALTLACRSSMVSWYKKKEEAQVTYKLQIKLCSCSYNWGKILGGTDVIFVAWPSSLVAHQIDSNEYGHFIQCVPTESTRLLTIKLGPCTLALRGPCNVNTKRGKIDFNKKQWSHPRNLK